ncbi:hypothetical protein M2132_002221 [Dysgonomonas sp. PH5-45]|uniref:hypothetical protein n=1 Tax=unclassified Dysgonomonas TaxID=2630389 RepID=UPI0024747769|nr:MULTISPECIES: hypothetical protein [unclassified Dysgonomonas]MDH6355871.1 hypothetical protein [Dysgonomonas sp. PH5-45]MDH6388766.1 hypothetical protein [Dysgonomonas sp. PH5-37]
MVDEILNTDPSLLEYANKARSKHKWDIKTKSPDGAEGIYYGSKLYGKYTSARDAGNFAAGAVAQKSIIPNFITDYGYEIYNRSENKIGKSINLLLRNGLNPIMIFETGLFGEDTLSKVGIEAGKSYIRNLENKR